MRDKCECLCHVSSFIVNHHSSITNHPFINSALLIVFFNSIATVIGPTPPGTGVIAPATAAAYA